MKWKDTKRKYNQNKPKKHKTYTILKLSLKMEIRFFSMNRFINEFKHTKDKFQNIGKE